MDIEELNTELPITATPWAPLLTTSLGKKVTPHQYNVKSITHGERKGQAQIFTKCPEKGFWLKFKIDLMTVILMLSALILSY